MMSAESGAAPVVPPRAPAPGGVVAIPPEPPDLAARTLTVASRLLAGGTTFFFLAFVFAYFYLRSINQEHMWRPAHTHLDPKQALGAAMAACLVVSALAAIAGARRMKTRAPGWIGLVAVALLLGLAAIALQCVEYTVQRFGPTDGAYASVFCAWTGLYLIAVLATMYWLETHLASELRARRSPAGHGEIAAPDLLIAPGIDATVFYWVFLAAIGVLMYVVLYLL
jgi:heme/copper-type cytochrome/quinol oxidase subunit 3